MVHTPTAFEIDPADSPLLETPSTGLSQEEVARRRAQGYGNESSIQTGRTYRQIIVQNTFTFINIIFFVVGGVMILLGLLSDAIISVSLVGLNVLIGISQEVRAKRQLDKIALLTRPTANVLRDGQVSVIDPSEIVLGDLLIVSSGDQIVVDGEVIGDAQVEVDESLLTGESDLILKSAGDKLLSGSFCVTGRATFIAQRVGVTSYANNLVQNARAFTTNKTPLQRDVDFIIRLLVMTASVYGILYGASFVLREMPAIESVRTAAVIITLIPNGLFFMVIAAYAMGALRMSGKGALIQQVNAIESMSNIDVLCLDKTGTLTANRMLLNEVLPAGDMDEDELKHILAAFAATLKSGNRTSEAIQRALPADALPMRDEIPFSSDRKWSGLVFDAPAFKGVYVLGAPEILYPHLAPDAWFDPNRVNEWAEHGLRVLVLTRHQSVDSLRDAQGVPLLPDNMETLGLLAFSDELRPEARETIEKFREAKIKLKVISGDNPTTVASLARQAGFAPDVKLISGLEIDSLDDAQLETVAEETTIFGRIRPDQKERIVEALKRRGFYVAMIGDGVNDVMSLKKAQIGIAMQSGSQATRGVADIVLINDSFAALPQAFLEGQRILNGMQDVVKLFLSRTLTVSLIIFGAAVVSDSSLFPFLPTHGALLTFLTVGIPTFFLAAWARPGFGERRLIQSVVHFVLPAALTLALFGVFVYVFYVLQTPPIISTGVEDSLTARWLAIPRSALTTFLIFCGWMLILFAEPPVRFFVGGDEYVGDIRPVLITLAMLVSFVVIVLVEPFRRFFQIELLMLTDYLFLASLTLLWGLMLRFMWRTNLFNKFLGLPQRRYHVGEILKGHARKT